jgi:hypothetical protein
MSTTPSPINSLETCLAHLRTAFEVSAITQAKLHFSTADEAMIQLKTREQRRQEAVEALQQLDNPKEGRFQLEKTDDATFNAGAYAENGKLRAAYRDAIKPIIELLTQAV